jgi:formylglycine-generating enzyme required for sulfatase activity
MNRLIVVAFSAIAAGLAPGDAGEGQTAQDHACVAATGEKIPHPWSKKTYTVMDGARRVEVPEGMVYVPEGKFIMGERESKHEVSLDGFCIGKYEVTNAEWKEFCGRDGAQDASAPLEGREDPRGQGEPPAPVGLLG